MKHLLIRELFPLSATKKSIIIVVLPANYFKIIYMLKGQILESLREIEKVLETVFACS